MEIEKDLVFEGSALRDLKAFPDEPRREIGFALHRLQIGELPTIAKPFKTAGFGTWELRADDADGWYRAIYVQLIKGKIHVLHCFQKKTRKTERIDVEIASKRFKSIKVRYSNEND